MKKYTVVGYFMGDGLCYCGHVPGKTPQEAANLAIEAYPRLAVVAVFEGEQKDVGEFEYQYDSAEEAV